MKFSFTAFIVGGIGPDVYDREETVSGEDLTIREALHRIESHLRDDEFVIGIEQDT